MATINIGQRGLETLFGVADAIASENIRTATYKTLPGQVKFLRHRHPKTPQNHGSAIRDSHPFLAKSGDIRISSLALGEHGVGDSLLPAHYGGVVGQGNCRLSIYDFRLNG